MTDDTSVGEKTERQKIIQRRAKELATQQGHDWKALSKEQRQALRVQVRDNLKVRRQARQGSAE